MIKKFKLFKNRLKNSNYLGTLFYNVELGFFPKIRFIVFPKCRVWLHKMAKVVINEKAVFNFGLAWQHTAYQTSSLKVDKNANLLVNGTFNFHTGAFISISSNATLEIGSGYCNNNVEICCFKSIKIGNNVAISKGVIIRDSDNHVIGNNHEGVSKPIIIGDNVWIGLNALILKGVRIGNGAVIAAGAVVNKDIPDFCLAGGVPARVIKQDIAWH
jgi:acetyltransferase-like isoleucine patch superfamily enzyme